MSTAISVENVSKSYRLGAIGGATLKEDAARWWAKWRGRPDPLLPVGDEHRARHFGEQFWALRDVSFDVRQGEVLGIVGRNGAGKSTLLKILSQVTSPSSGEIKIKGRIASLLEVGTGFHPELTGRENIFLNGAILGMTKAEIRRKMDEIIAFAGIDEFIDTPVKRYSSGMYVRLAFAVAAHLEPEILIVDEVLAVGDAEFQKKCLGKMSAVSRNGRTVLFVSHNMQAVGSLCDRAIWMDQGRVRDQGPVGTLIDTYLRDARSKSSEETPLADKPRTGSGIARFVNMRVGRVPEGSGEPDIVVPGNDLEIDLEIAARQALPESNVAVTIYDSNDYRLVDVNTALHGAFLRLPAGGSATVRFIVHTLLLKPGTYTIELWLGRGGVEDIDFVREAGTLEISEDVAAARHTETFPSPYQCRFTHRIQEHAAP